MSQFHLIFWRHAEAEDAPGAVQGEAADMARKLTKQGRRDAALMAAWIKSYVPKPWAVVCSPAERTTQTAKLLSDYPEPDERLRPGATVDELIALVREHPRERGALVIVGHQPLLGQAALRWLTGGTCDQQLALRKGALIWGIEREREVGLQRNLRACISPDLLRD